MRNVFIVDVGYIGKIVLSNNTLRIKELKDLCKPGLPVVSCSFEEESAVLLKATPPVTILTLNDGGQVWVPIYGPHGGEDLVHECWDASLDRWGCLVEVMYVVGRCLVFNMKDVAVAVRDVAFGADSAMDAFKLIMDGLPPMSIQIKDFARLARPFLFQMGTKHEKVVSWNVERALCLVNGHDAAHDATILVIFEGRSKGGPS